MGKGNVTKAAMLAESGLVKRPRQRNKHRNINIHVYISRKGSTGSGTNASPKRESKLRQRLCFEVANVSRGPAVSLISSASVQWGVAQSVSGPSVPCFLTQTLTRIPSAGGIRPPKAYERVHQLRETSSL